MGTIAGHAFLHGVCECGRRWADIRNVTDADRGQPNIAHVGNLTETELVQIAEARAVEDAAIERAMGWYKKAGVGGGGDCS